MIEIFCDDPSHMPRRFSWRLSRDRNGVWRTEAEVNDPRARWPKGFEIHKLITGVRPHGPFFANRFKYRFQCGWCRYTVPVRGEKLTAILDPLEAHGVPSLSLAQLATRVGSYGMTAQ